MADATTVDLIVSRGITPSFLLVPKRDWDGCSDHRPVIMELTMKMTHTIPGRQISKARRTNAAGRLRAENSYGSILPHWTRRIAQASEATVFAESVTDAVNALLELWRPYGKAPSPTRAREFWTAELEAVSKKYSKLYTRARKSDNPTHWRSYKELDCKIKRMAKRN